MLLAVAAAAIAAAGSPAELELELGARFELFGARCYRVTALDTGPGGARYAWLVAEEMPRGIVHMPARELVAARPGCRA